MMPNERWDDFAIDNFAESVKNFMEATAALPNQIVKLTGDIEKLAQAMRTDHEAVKQRLDSHHEWIEQVDQRSQTRYQEVKALVERVGADLRDDMKERARNRVSIVVAIISAGAIVAAAVISSAS